MKKLFITFCLVFLGFSLWGQKVNFKERYVCYWDEHTKFELVLTFKDGLLKKADMTSNLNIKFNTRLWNDKDTLKGFMTMRKHDKEYIFTGWLIDSNFLICETREPKTGKLFLMLPFLAGTEAETATESYKEFSSGKAPKFDELLIGKWTSIGYKGNSEFKSIKDLTPLEKEIKLEFKDNGGTKTENFWLTKDAKYPKNSLIYRIGENRIYYRLQTMEEQIVLYNILYYGIADKYLILTKGNLLYYFTKDNNSN